MKKLFEKVQRMFKSNGKPVAMSLVTALAVSAMAMPTFAAESDMVSVLTGSFSTMIADMMSTIAAILPVALPLLGLSLLVAFGIKWFKSIVKKA